MFIVPSMYSMYYATCPILCQFFYCTSTSAFWSVFRVSMISLAASSGVTGGGFASLHASSSFLYLHIFSKCRLVREKVVQSTILPYSSLLVSTSFYIYKNFSQQNGYLISPWTFSLFSIIEHWDRSRGIRLVCCSQHRSHIRSRATYQLAWAFLDETTCLLSPFGTLKHWRKNNLINRMGIKLTEILYYLKKFILVYFNKPLPDMIIIIIQHFYEYPENKRQPKLETMLELWQQQLQMKAQVESKTKENSLRKYFIPTW